MDVFLSLYVLPDDDGKSVIMPFLLAARDEDQAVDLSDCFIDAIETVAIPESDALDVMEAKNEIEIMRANVCLLEEPNEIAAVMECLREHNPNFEQESASLVGSVFTLGVTEDAGFTKATANLLRNRMSGHYLLSTLSVEVY